MKQEDIGAVLWQAAQLHANLCIAVDRSLHLHSGKFPVSSALRHDGCADDDATVADDDAYALPVSFATSHSAIEVRSLASIRDALEVLKEQLECLQSLPDHQKAEKNATLAELEESREILIRRLKQHQGRESAVIKEVLFFAGASQEEGVSLHRSYTMPERLTSRHKLMGVDEANNRDGNSCSDKCRRRPSQNGRRRWRTDGHASQSNLMCRVLTFLNGRFGRISAKCLLAAAGAAAVWKLSSATYGKGTRGQTLATSEVKQRSQCPQNWMAVQTGIRRRALMEPFNEEG